MLVYICVCVSVYTSTRTHGILSVPQAPSCAAALSNIVTRRSFTNVPFTHEESHTRKPATSGCQRDETGFGGARVGWSDSVEEQCHLPGAAVRSCPRMPRFGAGPVLTSPGQLAFPSHASAGGALRECFFLAAGFAVPPCSAGQALRGARGRL